MSVSEYPRVVVISADAMHTGASAACIRALFLDWDKNCLTQIMTPFTKLGSPDFGMCRDYRRMSWNGRARRLQPTMATVQRKVSLSKWILKRIEVLGHTPFLHRWGVLFRESWLSRSRYSHGLQTELASIQPDVVYTSVSTMFLAKAVSLACERRNIPLFVHVLNDYVKAKYEGVPFQNRIQASSEYWLKRVLKLAAGHAAVGPHMAAEYSKRYGGDWTWFTTLMDADDYDPTPRSMAAGEPLQILYAGNLIMNRWRTLRQLGLALKQLHDEGLRARLTICASPIQMKLYRAKLDIPEVVDLRGWVSPEHLPRVIHDADILVHCESFDRITAEYTKWSLSSKISQCMMSGRCILAIGPPALASIKFVKEYDAGIVIETEDVQTLKDKLRTALLDRARLTRLGQKGREKAMNLFEGTSQRERFRQALHETIRQHGCRRSTG